MYNTDTKEIDIIIPISLELDWPTYESIISDILFLSREYGFKTFALAGPGAGWRGRHYPPKDVFENLAHLFLKIKDALSPYGIECGWWLTTTLKSGPTDEFIRATRYDGSQSAFSSCPLDPDFIERFSDDIYTFSSIAKPAFIITEDDYSVVAAAGHRHGCFCDFHLKEFSKRTGKEYSREELVKIFDSDTPEGIELLKKWRELMKDSLIKPILAAREKLDKDMSHIPIGYSQSGACDIEGDCTEDLSRAMAGAKNIPFSRLCGAFYCGGDTKDIPKAIHHGLYFKQHIKGDFNCYYECDTYPHTRFFNSAKQIKSFMAAVFSHGFVGALFQVQQLLDNPNEEAVYSKMYKAERIRFNALHHAVEGCTQRGVEICYDPFYNTYDTDVKGGKYPLWVKPVSLFGIPFVTTKSDVAFWDIRQAKYYDEETVLEYLAKGLILDGDAAKELCRRGYGKYIGVDVGDDVTKDNMLIYDLGAREVICDKFIPYSKGRNMPSAHMYAAVGNGKLYRLTPNSSNCEIVSELYDFQKNFVSIAMTRFINSLGGKIVVMGETIDGNNSHSLLNYRRQKLIQSLINWCDDKNVYVCDEAGVYIIHNVAEKPEEKNFKHIFTLINMCEDSIDSVKLHLPPHMHKLDTYHYLDIDGEWKPLESNKTADGIEIKVILDYNEPVYIKAY